MFRKAALPLGVVLMATFAVGCAITDYSGWAGHQSQSEAKLWGKDVGFGGFGSDVDGTYNYTVKYDNRAGQGKVTINSYRNPVLGAFSRDGIVDRDGDDIQGRSGSLTAVPATPAGKYNKQFVAVDPTGGSSCEFFNNITFDKSAGGPQLALCIFGASEEVDKDLSLQEAFSSIGDLASQIWSGALGSTFSVALTSITVNGTPITLTNAFTMNVGRNSLRPINLAMDFSSPGGQEVLRALLNNTAHRTPATLSFGFDGGMTFALPGNLTAAFDHDALARGLK